jgi:NAD(P)-dependent dehydrogenase (short-subunit alcohol dehydrogenase family)
MPVAPHSWAALPDELADKTILVTGAAEGIGRAASLAFARCGAEVLLLSRNEARLEALYDEIVVAGGKEPGILAMDLAKATHDDYVTLAGSLSEAIPKLDGLLHNASLLGDRKPIAQTRAASWHDVMQVNVNAGFMLTQTLLPLLDQSPSASVVFTSSGVGRKGRAYWGSYAVSKFATEGLMQVLADELGATSNIRVNSLNPGAVNTSMRRSAYPAEPPTTNPSPEDIIREWVFLMSDGSNHLNGEALSAQ